MPIDLIEGLKAVSNERRLDVLEWLKNPRAHFREQLWGDLVEDGVCGLFIAEKLGVSQPTASQHLNLLVGSGLLTPKRIKQWTFYRRNEAAIEHLKNAITHSL
jgi:ArsR family transcriptional regulator